MNQEREKGKKEDHVNEERKKGKEGKRKPKKSRKQNN